MNLDSVGMIGVSWTQEQQTSLQGVFGRSRELLLSKAVSPYRAPPTNVFETARCADQENERRPPISELKKFFEEYKRSKYEFTYTDIEGIFFIGPDGTAGMKKSFSRPNVASSTASSSSSGSGSSGEASSSLHKSLSKGQQPSSSSSSSSSSSRSQVSQSSRQHSSSSSP